MHYMISLGKSHPNIAYLYSICGYIFITITQILFKYITPTLTVFQVIVLRSVMLIFINLSVLKSVDQSPYIKDSGSTYYANSDFRMVLARILILASSLTIMLYCTTHIPVSTVSTLYNTGPIFIFFI